LHHSCLVEKSKHKNRRLSTVRDRVDLLNRDHRTTILDRQRRGQQTHESAVTRTTTANEEMQWDNFPTDDGIGEVDSNNDSKSIISNTLSMRHLYEKSQEFLSRNDVSAKVNAVK
jgi:hypothetical protein